MERRLFIAGGMAMATSGLRPAFGAGSNLMVPPEESQHQATFMQWPVSRKVYRDRYYLGMVQQAIANIANAISKFEPVIMLADKADHAAARRLLAGDVDLWDVSTEDLWCRDAGPLFAVQNGALVVSHIQFNGWGQRQVHARDARIAATVAERLGVTMVSSGLRGEPGGAEHDGHGLVIAHESSWVHDNRNAGLSKAEITDRLKSAYGATSVLWGKGVKDEDITDFHIDSLARFTSAGRVLINLPKQPDRYDPFHVAALETHDVLVAAGLDVDVIPEPVKRRVKSLDFVASYANYYACNGAIIAAEFGDAETDAIANEALARHYPGREVVMLNVDPLGELGGGIHCATQQMPAV